MNNEILFAKTLEAVRKKAREQGNVISKQQVEEAFAVLALEESQLELVYDYLKKNKIGIDENIDLDEYLSEEEKDYDRRTSVETLKFILSKGYDIVKK